MLFHSRVAKTKRTKVWSNFQLVLPNSLILTVLKHFYDTVQLGAGGKLVGRRLQAKARKHDLIRGLAESKLTTIADRISVAQNDDKITEKEFRLILSEVDNYN